MGLGGLPFGDCCGGSTRGGRTVRVEWLVSSMYQRPRRRGTAVVALVACAVAPQWVCHEWRRSAGHSLAPRASAPLVATSFGRPPPRTDVGIGHFFNPPPPCSARSRSPSASDASDTDIVCDPPPERTNDADRADRHASCRAETRIQRDPDTHLEHVSDLLQSRRNEARELGRKEERLEADLSAQKEKYNRMMALAAAHGIQPPSDGNASATVLATHTAAPTTTPTSDMKFRIGQCVMYRGSGGRGEPVQVKEVYPETKEYMIALDGGCEGSSSQARELRVPQSQLDEKRPPSCRPRP